MNVLLGSLISVHVTNQILSCDTTDCTIGMLNSQSFHGFTMFLDVELSYLGMCCCATSLKLHNLSVQMVNQEGKLEFKNPLNFTCLRSTDPGGGIGYVPSLNSQSNFFCWILKFFFINSSCLYFVYCFFSFKICQISFYLYGPDQCCCTSTLVIRWQQVFLKTWLRQQQIFFIVVV